MAPGTVTGAGVVCGVDKARRGWVVATPPDQVVLVATFAEVKALADAAGATAVGVDMPIGLPHDGWRGSDAAARELLGPRRSSLFPTPARAVLAATTYPEALALSRAASGRGLSKQAFHLLPAIREVRAALTPGDQPRFFEAHPETTFACMAGAPLSRPKRDPAGAAERRALVAAAFPRAPVDDVPAGARPDDLLDAWAAAWTAGRVAARRARWLGTGVDDDGYSLSMAV